jgi:hypothetical protein
LNLNSGAVYVYKRTGSSWNQEAYIKAVNNNAGDWFGYSTSLSGDTLAVGAREEDSNQTTITNGTTASGNNSNTDSGAVYLYKRTGSTWAQEAYIKAVNNDTGDYFGWSTSLSGDTLAVGATLEDSNQITITNGTTVSANNSNAQSGAVYVYKRSGSSWAQEAYIKAVNNDPDDGFGSSTSLSGDTLAVAWIGRDDNLPIRLTGATGALRIWTEAMRLHGISPINMDPPPAIEWHRVTADGAATVDEDCANARLIPMNIEHLPPAASSCGEAAGAWQNLRSLWR